MPPKSSCPRCQGTMQIQEDEYGIRHVCMMCGRDYEIPSHRYPPYNPKDDPPPKKRLRSPWSHYHP